MSLLFDYLSLLVIEVVLHAFSLELQVPVVIDLIQAIVIESVELQVYVIDNHALVLLETVNVLLGADKVQIS